MPHHRMAAVCLVMFFAALTHPALAQNAPSSKCPGEWSPVECEVRGLTAAYFAALKAKDWNALSRIGLASRESETVQLRSGTNLSLRLLQQFLDDLKIEALSYTLTELIIGSDEVTVSYTLQLKATDLRSGKTVINISGAQRMLEWMNIPCNCPQTGMRAWLFKRDAFKAEGLARSYLKARNDRERKFILIGPEKSALQDTSGVLQQWGLDLIESKDYPGASKLLTQAQAIHIEINSQARLSSQLDLEETEQWIREAQTQRNVQTLAVLMKSAGGIYTGRKANKKEGNYLQ